MRSRAPLPGLSAAASVRGHHGQCPQHSQGRQGSGESTLTQLCVQIPPHFVAAEGTRAEDGRGFSVPGGPWALVPMWWKRGLLL